MAADFFSFLPQTEDVTHTGVVSSGFQVPPKPERISLQRLETAIVGLAVPPVVDLLSIDIEGHELAALRSIPFDRFLFRAIVVETHLYDEEAKQYKWKHRDLAEIEALLQRYGYLKRESTWVNTFYLPKSP